MKKKFLILITVLVLGGLILSACSSGGESGFTTFSGTVVYEGSNKGIYNAEVYLDNEQEPRDETDKNGEFYISGLSKNYYNLRVEKNEFNIYEGQININTDNNIVVELVPSSNNTIISGEININNSTGYETESLSSQSKSYKTLSNVDLKKKNNDYIENELIVKYSDSNQVSSLNNSNQVQGLSLAKSINVGRGKLVKYNIPDNKSVEEMIEYFETQPGVEYVEPNYIVYAQERPNDPEYGSQWNMISANMEAAWDQQQTSDTILVAVLDSGVIKDHPDLVSNLNDGIDFVYGSNNGDPSNPNFTDENPTDETPYNDSSDGSHGTHIAGIIGAVTNNRTGVAGMSWDIRLLPVRVLNSEQRGNHYDIAEGIYYSVNSFAQIINMSFGGENSSNTLKEAVEYADSQGSIIISASGNEGNNSVLYPAAYSEVIAVGAVDKNNKRTDYSNYGSELDLVASGGDFNIDNGVFSTWGYYDPETEDTESGYAYMDGTSMAAAHVSGAAALLLASDNTLTSSAIKERLTSTAVDLGLEGKDLEYGYGLIDVYGALIDQKLKRPYIFISEDNIIENITQSSIIDNATVQMDEDGTYTLSDEIVGRYYVFAWRDVDSDFYIDAGDYFGVTDSTTDFDLRSYYTIDVDMNYVTERNVSSGSLSY